MCVCVPNEVARCGGCRNISATGRPSACRMGPAFKTLPTRGCAAALLGGLKSERLKCSSSGFFCSCRWVEAWARDVFYWLGGGTQRGLNERRHAGHGSRCAEFDMGSSEFAALACDGCASSGRADICVADLASNRPPPGLVHRGVANPPDRYPAEPCVQVAERRSKPSNNTTRKAANIRADAARCAFCADFVLAWVLVRFASSTLVQSMTAGGASAAFSAGCADKRKLAH